MSKRILLNTEVMNLIVKELIGPEAIDQYWPRPTEWANATKSDVLYAADDASTFPPILIEVQYIADSRFLHRLVQYCEEVNKQHHTEPVVLVFVINKTRANIMRKATKDQQLPFLFKLPSFPWAKKCFILNNDSIRDHLLSTPLCPLAALGAFFTAQKPSLVNHDQRDDPIIQKLYSISMQVFGRVTIHDKTTVEDLLCICDNAQSKFQESIEILEDLPDTSSKKRAIDCLNGGLEILKSYKCKYIPSQSPSPSPSPSSSPSPSLPVSSSSSLAQVSTQIPSSLSRNWKFVEDYIQGLGAEKMNWNICYLKGQRQGYFTNYTKPSSLKSAYQRWKNNKK